MRKWLPLIAVCLGSFMLLIDVTIVNVALPDIAQDLKTSFGSLQWVVDAYALTLAALILAAGSRASSSWLSEGKRRGCRPTPRTAAASGSARPAGAGG